MIEDEIFEVQLVEFCHVQSDHLALYVFFFFFLVEDMIGYYTQGCLVITKEHSILRTIKKLGSMYTSSLVRTHVNTFWTCMESVQGFFI